MYSIQKFGVRYKYVFGCLFVLGAVNILLLSSLSGDTSRQIKSQAPEAKVVAAVNSSFLAVRKITNALRDYESFFAQLDLPLYPINVSFFNNETHLGSNVWDTAASWVTKDRLYSRSAPIHEAIEALKTRAILSADVSNRGTQLKMALVLDGGQKALFKPKWYEREEVIKGPVYAGKDRHNGEIAAFHIARLLGLNRAPIAALRVLDLANEILPVASLNLSKTFFTKGNNTCFYGVCLYCGPQDPVCANGVHMEGAISLWIPEKWSLKKVRHPWRRSYNSLPSNWVMFDDYCSIIRKSRVFSRKPYLLDDLVETAVFDFLIDNGDRHHFEYLSNNGSVLLIDNGKSFGNPLVDHLDILAPLFQCCRVRRELLSYLIQLQGGKFSVLTEKLLTASSDTTLLTKLHLLALDRRLEIVLAAIMVCIKEKGVDEVLAY